jgi:hypothetical protein
MLLRKLHGIIAGANGAMGVLAKMITKEFKPQPNKAIQSEDHKVTGFEIDPPQSSRTGVGRLCCNLFC